MTVPNTSAEPDPLPTAPDELASEPGTPTVLSRLWAEVRVFLPIAFGCALFGLLMGALWYWLAPEVPLVKQGNSVLYVDPEGEQSAGAVGTFVLLGVAFGLVTSLVAFLLTRRRGGGIAVSLALGLGGVAGSLIAVWLGEKLGPTSDIIGHAKQAGDGHTFYENLTLPAHGALLAWSIAAMVLLLVLTATFGKREPEPEPVAQWGAPVPPAEYGGGDPWAPPAAPVAPAAPPAGDAERPSHGDSPSRGESPSQGESSSQGESGR